MSISETNALDALAIASDAGQGERILNDVYKFTGRFVSYPNEATHVAHTLWIAHTHLMNRWESTPRLAFLSPEPASDKSRALEVTEPLVPFPMEAVNVSASSLFRSIGNQEGLPTILYDEVDTVFGPRTKDNNEDIRGLLNAGHHKGAKAYRSVLNGKQVAVEAIEVYCAVALAGLGWLPDTLLSRSIIVRMRRRHKGEQVEAFRRRIHRIEGRGLRERLAVWARSLPDPEWPELPAEIQDRAADCWEPLVAVADAAGGSWPARARSAALALVAERSEAEPSLGIRLLSDLRSVFGDQDDLTSKAILAALHALPESPWADMRGKPLDERGLAHRLRQYGVKPKTIRIGTTTPRGYTKADLHDVWARYTPSPADLSETNKTGATKPSNGVAHVADVLEIPKRARMVCDHCQAPEADADPLLEVIDGSGGALLHQACIKPWNAMEIPGFLDRRGVA